MARTVLRDRVRDRTEPAPAPAKNGTGRAPQAARAAAASGPQVDPPPPPPPPPAGAPVPAAPKPPAPPPAQAPVRSLNQAPAAVPARSLTQPPTVRPVKPCWDSRVTALYADLLGLLDDLDAGRCWGIGWGSKLAYGITAMDRMQGWPDAAAEEEFKRLALVHIKTADDMEYAQFGATQA